MTWEVPSDVGGAIATGDDDSSSDASAITDPAQHLLKKPVFRYNFRNPITDPMNVNYKFSRRIEFSCFGREDVRNYIMANFRPEKAQMSGDDLGTPETQANVTFYTYAGVEMMKLTTSEADFKKLKPATITGIMKGVVRKHQTFLREEVQAYEDEKKAKEKAEKEAAKAGLAEAEVED